METVLDRALEAQSVESKEGRYDGAVKRVLSCKEVAATILQLCVDEFKSFSRDEIMANLGPSYVGSAPVDPGRVQELNTEDNADGRITFDVLFTATVPGSQEQVQLIINLEAQQSIHLGYPLIKRGIYYASRLISRQKGEVFSGSEYGKIKKVCSVWLFYHPEEVKHNAVTSYDIRPTTLIGNDVEKESDYDLIQILFAYIGGPQYQNFTGALPFLEAILNANRGTAERLNLLQKEFGLALSNETKGAITEMCNLSQAVKAEGRAEGRAEGAFEKQIQNLRNLMRNLNVPLVKAMELLGIPEEDRPAIIAKMGQ